MFDRQNVGLEPHVWEVGSLCRAISDALQARFNPVAVRGEISGFSRAASGHCYFSIKDPQGQIRCAMFKRAASMMDFSPRDGELVEVRGRLGVYEARGDLQLVVESMQRAGQGALFEQFLRLKAKLEQEGLFDSARKRELPVFPRAIGVVTSPGAAAWHDVMTALKRRVPHIPVVMIPALVQGAQAPASIVRALEKLYSMAGDDAPEKNGVPPVDVILLVRGGGSIEDLWAFNDEQLARIIVQSPVPLVSGVGHETDFTIADFCADLRAPTPTAAAELVAQPRDLWLGALELMQERLTEAVERQLDRHAQCLDMAARQISRPSNHIAKQRLELMHRTQRLQQSVQQQLHRGDKQLEQWSATLPRSIERSMGRLEQRLANAATRLELLNPQHVLARGYSLLSDARGRTVTSVKQAPPGTALNVAVSDGVLDVVVTPPRLL
ncbi:exodeoxyribonuclease VII large subunit [Diaphorobacter sp. HDW4B]|uniref:exodeoxyribonuclease VII large subunit n=1 Tax=Diaphorobacter sp. HDW4B TaxID=2714925 RepID=UPI001409A4D0|nr:exodeoxyribonuclease VII large subunit [Diaphorobacter sp. HDW4B]QIL72659.1 exodeoxyribonuclease VII large subunit [Diaphorobacter sp. HDW4B]